MLSQQPENQKNLLLAIVLSVGVMAAWNFFYAAPKYKEEQERLKRAQQSQSEMQSGTVAPGTTAPAAGAGPAVAPPSQVTIAPPPGLTRDAALGLAPRIGIETPALTGSISLKGGRIDDLSLVRYRETVDPKSPNVVLFSPADAPSPYFAEYGWSAGPAAAGNPAPKLPDRDTMWSQAGAQSLTPTTPIQMTWDNGQGLKFRRSIGVDADYMFKITDTVENATAADVTLFPYARIYRYGTPTVQGIYILHEGMVGVLGEQSLKEYTYSELQKDGGGGAFQKISGGWLGFTDKYWAAVLIPNQTSVYAANMHQVGKKSDTTKESYQADVVQDGVMIPAGGVRSIDGQLFAGAKQVQLIDGYKSTYGIQKFDLMIDWGWFWFSPSHCSI
jgi:YidC/Oxa1 family membrane protein insertase